MFTQARHSGSKLTNAGNLIGFWDSLGIPEANQVKFLPNLGALRCELLFLQDTQLLDVRRCYCNLVGFFVALP